MRMMECRIYLQCFKLNILFAYRSCSSQCSSAKRPPDIRLSMFVHSVDIANSWWSLKRRIVSWIRTRPINSRTHWTQGVRVSTAIVVGSDFMLRSS